MDPLGENLMERSSGTVEGPRRVVFGGILTESHCGCSGVDGDDDDEIYVDDSLQHCKRLILLQLSIFSSHLD